jgi:hypothetical protein
MTIAGPLAALKNEKLCDTYRYHRKRLDALFSGKHPAKPFGLNGITANSTEAVIDPSAWFAESVEELADQVEPACDELIFRPMSICHNPYGVHFIDILFGADVFFHPDSEQWQVHTFKGPVGSLSRPDIEQNPAWTQAREIARLFLAHDLPNVVLELPTLSSALNIAVNLYGQEILIAMLEDPAAARNDLRVINDLIIELHDWYSEHIPADRFQSIVASGRFQPFGHGQLCGCTTQLTSNEIYQEFVAGLDAEVLGRYARGGMIHLCGTHAQHIPSWREMSELKAVQLNDTAAEDLAAYFQGLRSDQILYVNYFKGMTANQALSITGGERLVLVGDFDEEVREVIR